VLSQTWFMRYLPSLESLRVRRGWFGRGGEGQRRGVWFVGSWVGEGVPLLEGCVVSAGDVVQEIVDLELGGRKGL
jgi:hypothetical protein